MGCASSSPLAAANGGILHAAKGAVTDVVHSGEEKLHDAKESISDTITGTVDTVKGAVVGAVDNVGKSLENVLQGNKEPKNKGTEIMTKAEDNLHTVSESAECVVVPLKDKVKETEDDGEKALSDLSNIINKKSKEFSDDTDKLADDLIRETEDVASETLEKVTSSVNKVLETSMSHPRPETEAGKAFTSMVSTNSEMSKQNLSDIGKFKSIDVSEHSIDMESTPLSPDNELEKTKTDSTVASTISMQPIAKDEQSDALKDEMGVVELTKSLEKSSEVALDMESAVDPREDGAIVHNGDSSQQDEYGDSAEGSPSPPSAAATAWEKLTDAIIKVPSNQIQSYQKNVKRISQRSVSVDNILGSRESYFSDILSKIELY